MASQNCVHFDIRKSELSKHVNVSIVIKYVT